VLKNPGNNFGQQKPKRFVKIVGGIGVVKLLCAIGQFEDLIAAFGSRGRSDS
jgi:hypothetical protein